MRWEIKEVYDTYAVVEVIDRNPFTGEEVSTTYKRYYDSSFEYIKNPSDLKNRPIVSEEYKSVPTGVFKCYKLAYGFPGWSVTYWYEESTGILIAREAESFGSAVTVTVQLKSTNITL